MQLRQGDVLIERIGDTGMLPVGLSSIERDQEDRVILALGESTGHAHAIAERNAELFGKPGSDERWLVIRSSGTAIEGGGAVLRHEEHAAIVLEPGVYRVTRQREYQPQALPRYVAD